MKMNPEKCHIMTIGNADVPEHFTLNIDNIEKVAEDKLCLLGITTDRKLNFNSHIENLCIKEACMYVKFIYSWLKKEITAYNNTIR